MIAADPTGQLKFDESVVTVAAGKVTFDFTNRSPLPHNLTIAKGTAVLGATPTFQGGTGVDGDARARHVRLLLLGPRPSRRHAYGTLKVT